MNLCQHIFTILLIFFHTHAIIKLGSQSVGWFPSPKGGGAMSTYEELSVILGVATLIVTILIYMNSKNGTKK